MPVIDAASVMHEVGRAGGGATELGQIGGQAGPGAPAAGLCRGWPALPAPAGGQGRSDHRGRRGLCRRGPAVFFCGS